MKKIIMSMVAAATLGFAGGNVTPEVVEPVEPTLTGFYIGAGYSFIDGEATDYFDTVEVQNNAVDLRVGYNFNDYVAVEGRYAIGAKDNLALNGYDLVEEGDYDTWGLFVKPQYPVTKDATIYALLGYGNITGSVDDVEYLDENGFQWGLGAKYAVTTNVEVFADYINVYDDTVTVEGENIDFDAYTVTIGVNYKF